MFANKPTAKPKTLKPISTNSNPFAVNAKIDSRSQARMDWTPREPIVVPTQTPVAPTAQQAQLDALLASDHQAIPMRRERRQTTAVDVPKQVVTPTPAEVPANTVGVSPDLSKLWEEHRLAWNWAEQTEVDHSRVGALNWRKHVIAYRLTPEEFAVAAGHLLSQVNVSERDLVNAIAAYKPVQPGHGFDEETGASKPIRANQVESIIREPQNEEEQVITHPEKLVIEAAHLHSTPIEGTPVDALTTVRATDVTFWYAELTADESAQPPEGDMNFEPERDIVIGLPGPVPTRVNIPDQATLCLIRDAGTPWHVCNIVKLPFQVKDSIKVYETVFDAILEIHLQYGYFGDAMTYWFARTRGTHISTTSQWGEALLWAMTYAERHHSFELRAHYTRLVNALLAHSSHARLYHELLLDAKIMMFNVPTGATPFSIAGKLNVGFIDYYVCKSSLWFEAVQSVSVPRMASTPQGELIDRARALVKAMGEHALSGNGQVPTLTSATAALERFKREHDGDAGAISLFASVLSGMHNATIN